MLERYLCSGFQGDLKYHKSDKKINAFWENSKTNSEKSVAVTCMPPTKKAKRVAIFMDNVGSG